MQVGSLQRYARHERLAGHVGFWWGLAEGLFFFIVPDVYISYAALFSLRAGALAWLTSIAGSMLAIASLYLLMVVLRLDYLAFLAFIPGISGPLIQRVGQSLTSHGLPYTPLLVLSGVPLKVYGAQAFSLGLSVAVVLPWAVFARFVRIAPTFIAVAVLRLLWRQRIDRHPLGWCAVLGLFWIGFYVFYFIRMSQA